MYAKKEIRQIKLLNGDLLKYELERKSVKNINLRVRKDGSVHVSAPASAAIKRIEAFIIQNTDFILKTTQRMQEISRKNAPKSLQNGTVLYFQGVPYTLYLIKGAPALVRLSGQVLLLQCADPEDEALIRQVLMDFYRKMAAYYFKKALDAAYPDFQPYKVPAPSLTIRDMKSRWGSCIPAKKKITLNLQLMKYPPECLKEVVYHEFCHFIHLNHSKDFYALLTHLYPEWKKANALLRKPL